MKHYLLMGNALISMLFFKTFAVESYDGTAVYNST